MANGFSFAVRGSNGTMSYTDNTKTTFTASVRIKTLTYNYGVASDESHARENRAFYPHRREAGQFAVTLDCIGYKEFKQAMGWLQSYADATLSGAEANSAIVSSMDVSIPARKFHRQGILTTGIDDHNQTASMVFNPELVFLTISDRNDAAIPLITQTSASTFSKPQNTTAGINAFYPASNASFKDSLLYDVPGGIPTALDVIAASVYGAFYYNQDEN